MGLLQPKDIGIKEEFTEKPPLFRMDGASSGRGMLVLAGAVGFMLVAIIYISGVVLSNAVFSGVALVAAVVLSVALFIAARRSVPEKREMDAKEIDAAVEKYRIDLANTYIGYDLEYTQDDLDGAAAVYREQLEEERASLAAIDFKALLKMLRPGGNGKSRRGQRRRGRKAADDGGNARGSLLDDTDD